MSLRWQIWISEKGASDTLASVDSVASQPHLLADDAQLLCTFEAATYEEARAIWKLRRGLGGLTPQELGVPEDCSRCGAVVWSEGSRACWRCQETAS